MRQPTFRPGAERREAQLVMAFYDQAWNAWNDDVVEDILSPTFSFRGSLGDAVQGLEGWRGYRDAVRRAVPDFHNQVIELLAEPGRAAARLRYTGHHHGVLLGRRGHGQAISYDGSAFFTAAEGRLTSAWVLGDLDTLRAQIGHDS